MKITSINLPIPSTGDKCWLLEDKGIFVLQEGRGVLQSIFCTRAGAGALVAYDGVPDENGFFPDEQMPVDHPDYFIRNGRKLFEALPVVIMGYTLCAGFRHGLTIRTPGGNEQTKTIASITWMEDVPGAS